MPDPKFALDVYFPCFRGQEKYVQVNIRNWEQFKRIKAAILPGRFKIIAPDKNFTTYPTFCTTYLLT